jgi:hypothetical protein
MFMENSLNLWDQIQIIMKICWPEREDSRTSHKTGNSWLMFIMIMKFKENTRG